jgi:hypothetical protein
MVERQLGAREEVGSLVLAAGFDGQLNRIPKRCPITLSHQDCGPACEGEGRGCYPGCSWGVGRHGSQTLCGVFTLWTCGCLAALWKAAFVFCLDRMWARSGERCDR